MFSDFKSILFAFPFASHRYASHHYVINDNMPWNATCSHPAPEQGPCGVLTGFLRRNAVWLSRRNRRWKWLGESAGMLWWKPYTHSLFILTSSRSIQCFIHLFYGLRHTKNGNVVPEALKLDLTLHPETGSQIQCQFRDLRHKRGNTTTFPRKSH
jgi:hypothetical protein